jgi:ABC-type multidrug transport system fused ATPase/permease subunit
MMHVGGVSMNNKIGYILFVSLLSFSFIGLLITLMNDPMWLFRFILITAIIIGIIYIIMKKFVFKSSTIFTKEHKAFQKAARFSKRKYRRNTKQPTYKKKNAIRKRTASSTHLTVIEGKKGKKKNRALH